MRGVEWGFAEADRAVIRQLVMEQLLFSREAMLPIMIASRICPPGFTVVQQRTLVVEVALACDLLVLRDCAQGGNTGYQATMRLRERLRPGTTPPLEKEHRLRRYGTPAWLLATATVVSGCSFLAVRDSASDAQPSDGGPLRTRVPLASIAQFAERAHQVFRYCTTDCPERTPKTLASNGDVKVALEGQELRTWRMTPTAPKEAARVITSPDSETHVAAGVPTADLPARPVSDSAESLVARPAAVAVPPPPARVVEDPVAVPPRELSAVIPFAAGAQTLGPRGRDELGALMERAKTAQEVWLRGSVATRVLTKDMKRLAVGRAIAVRAAMVARGVQKEKIRIRAPRENAPIAGDPSAALNRCVTVQFR